MQFIHNKVNFIGIKLQSTVTSRKSLASTELKIFVQLCPTLPYWCTDRA